MLDASFADLCSKQRPKSVPPKPNRFVAHIDTTFVEQIFHITKGQRKTDIEHHRQTDNLAARFEIAKWVRFGHVQTVQIRSARLKTVSSGKTGAGALVSNGSAAPLLGKFRDETGDILTPSHTQKGNQRHHYYVSNRLISGNADPAGWRLSARALEGAVANAVASHLKHIASRHEIRRSADVVASSIASDAAKVLAGEIETNGAKTAAPLVQSGEVGNGRLRLRLSASIISEKLSVEIDDLSETLLYINVPLTIRRRGVEMKIIAGEQEAAPDKTLLRALRNAHAWVAQMKIGTSIKQIAANTSVSESYISRIVPMAFLSPRIQQSILTGAHPIDLTLEAIARARLPVEWSAQERLLGFAKSG